MINFSQILKKITEKDDQTFIIYFLICLLSIFTITLTPIFLTIQNRPRHHRRLPPSPLAFPIIGHLHLLLRSLPHRAFQKISTRHGKLVHLYLGSVPCVVVSSAEMAKEFLQTHESSFLNRPQMKAVDYLTYGSADFSFAPYGAYWKFMKKVCMSELLGGRTLDGLAPVRDEEMRRFIRNLLVKAEMGKEVDVGDELMRMAHSVISRITVGKIKTWSDEEDEVEDDEMRKLVKDVALLTGTFNLSDYIWFCKNLDLQGLGKKVKEVHGRFDEMMERIIKEHEEKRKNMSVVGEKDLLHILLDKFEDEHSEIKLTKENIKSFVLDIYAAGTDAPAITTEWAMAELINHPTIMNKAKQELESVVGKTRLVQETDIPNLQYLQAIVKETLRLHSSPLIVRESSQNCIVNGFEIPAKTQLYVNLWAIGRDPNHWKNPLEFKPERFLEKERDFRGQNFEFLPFGSGRRSCPGTTLALLMVQIALASMVQCFDWSVNGRVDMEEGPGLTLPRAKPLVCVPMACISESFISSFVDF